MLSKWVGIWPGPAHAGHLGFVSKWVGGVVFGNDQILLSSGAVGPGWPTCINFKHLGAGLCKVFLLRASAVMQGKGTHLIVGGTVLSRASKL